jgi:hypothetical protein
VVAVAGSKTQTGASLLVGSLQCRGHGCRQTPPPSSTRRSSRPPPPLAACLRASPSTSCSPPSRPRRTPDSAPSPSRPSRSRTAAPTPPDAGHWTHIPSAPLSAPPPQRQLRSRSTRSQPSPAGSAVSSCPARSRHATAGLAGSWTPAACSTKVPPRTASLGTLFLPRTLARGSGHQLWSSRGGSVSLVCGLMGTQ